MFSAIQQIIAYRRVVFILNFGSPHLSRFRSQPKVQLKKQMLNTFFTGFSIRTENVSSSVYFCGTQYRLLQTMKIKFRVRRVMLCKIKEKK